MTFVVASLFAHAASKRESQTSHIRKSTRVYHVSDNVTLIFTEEEEQRVFLPIDRYWSVRRQGGPIRIKASSIRYLTVRHGIASEK